MTSTTRTTLLGLAALIAAPLGACAPDRIVTGSTYPMDYRARHPIVLAHAPQTLDLFVAPAGLGPRQREDVWSFAADYRRAGEGFISAEVPQGSSSGASSRRALAVVQAALAEAGVPRSRIRVSSYAVMDDGIAAPVRLSFRRLEAKVGGPCGLWPQDLGVSDVGFNARNEPYWNLGCAMQSNIASQAADPIDLVRGREEGRVDTIRRMNNIEKLRQAQDPSTAYKADDDKINQVVGN
jgi:pilus assembly protein CpaD